jgi:hypothetical protein
MNRKNIAIAAMLVAIALSAAVFTMPTRQALGSGFFGTKVDQRINQLNKCTNQSPDNNYQQSSYDPNSDNKPSTDSSSASLNQTTSNNHGNTANQVNSGNANQTTSDNHGNTKNRVSSGEDNSDNKQPNSSNGDEKHNNHLVICVNKANNLAQFN